MDGILFYSIRWSIPIHNQFNRVSIWVTAPKRANVPGNNLFVHETWRPEYIWLKASPVVSRTCSIQSFWTFATLDNVKKKPARSRFQQSSPSGWASKRCKSPKASVASVQILGKGPDPTVGTKKMPFLSSSWISWRVSHVKRIIKYFYIFLINLEIFNMCLDCSSMLILFEPLPALHSNSQERNRPKHQETDTSGTYACESRPA